MKKNELKQINLLVYEILKHNKDARDNDDLLYIAVCTKINKKVLEMPFWLVMSNRKIYDLPNYETVRRSRQKIQQTFPEMKGSKAVERFRIINEIEYQEFYGGRNV